MVLDLFTNIFDYPNPAIPAVSFVILIALSVIALVGVLIKRKWGVILVLILAVADALYVMISLAFETSATFKIYFLIWDVLLIILAVEILTRIK